MTTKARVSACACVHAFNHALDRVEAKILEAAQVEEGGEWPPIEIGLVNAALPPPGWRSASRRAKVINALRSVRLPEFEAGDKPARAFIEYVAKVLPDYPDEYGRCHALSGAIRSSLSQARRHTLDRALPVAHHAFIERSRKSDAAASAFTFLPVIRRMISSRTNQSPSC